MSLLHSLPASLPPLPHSSWLPSKRGGALFHLSDFDSSWGQRKGIDRERERIIIRNENAGGGGGGDEEKKAQDVISFACLYDATFSSLSMN